MRLRFSFLAVALLCGAAAVPSAGAAAPQDASFVLKPVTYDPALTATKSYFILATKPGAVVRDRVRIVNTGGKTGTAVLSAVDATTGKASGAVYFSRNAPRRDVGAWISIAQPKVTLAPGKDAVVRFTVHVPRAARPGDHLGAIVAEDAQHPANGRGWITAVELQLPGPVVGGVVATAVWTGGEHGYRYLYLHLASTSTVLTKAAATLTVRDEAGRVVARRSIQLDTFVPGTTIDYPALLPKHVLKPGRYTAEVRVHSSAERVPGYRKAAPAPFDETRSFPLMVSSDGQTQVSSGAPSVVPTESAPKTSGSKGSHRSLAVVALLALLVIAVVVLLRRRRSRKDGPGRPAATPSPDEPAPDALAAAEAEEAPTWAGLIAAYDSKARNGEDGSAADHETEELAPAAAAVPVEANEPDHKHEQEAAVEPEPAFENQPEPWFEPPPEVEAYEPEPEPPVPAPAGLEAEQLKALIVQHDLAVAEAKLRAPEPEPLPAPAKDTEGNLSAALVDAGLIALATLVATRLLKNGD